MTNSETRRHVSLTDFNQDGEMFNDIGLDVENRVFDKFDKNFLREIISKLKPDEQDLINKLCLDDEPMTQKQYANTLGITENAVRKRLKKVRTKLKNLV